MQRIELRRVLAIGGSDSGGGAGIQGDIKTGAALGVDVATAITAIIAQNSLGVQAIEPVPLNMFCAQISSVCSDLPLHAIKLGMLCDGARVRAVIAAIEKYRLNNIVCDPCSLPRAANPSRPRRGEGSGFCTPALHPADAQRH